MESHELSVTRQRARSYLRCEGFEPPRGIFIDGDVGVLADGRRLSRFFDLVGKHVLSLFMRRGNETAAPTGGIGVIDHPCVPLRFQIPAMVYFWRLPGPFCAVSTVRCRSEEVVTRRCVSARWPPFTCHP